MHRELGIPLNESALIQLSSSKRDKIDKITRDLREGFRVNSISPESQGGIAVVTRNYQDLFILSGSSTTFRQSFRMVFEIKRVEDLRSDVFYESWLLHSSNNHPSLKQIFTKGPGGTDALDFWRRYKLSVPDQFATDEYMQIQRDKFSRVRHASFDVQRVSG